MSELVAEVVVNAANLYVDGSVSVEVGALHANRGQVFEVALSVAPAILRELRRGSLSLRLRKPDDVIIRAPKRPRESWTLADATERYGAAVQSRALELCLKHSGPHAAPEPLVELEGARSWLDYAAHEKMLELNAGLDRELAAWREALEGVRSFQARQEQLKLQEAEAAAEAARKRMKIAQKLATTQTLEEMQEELRQAEAQVEVFERCGVEPEKMDRAIKKLEAAKEAVAARNNADAHGVARSWLQKALAVFDGGTREAELKPLVDAARVAFEAGDYAEVRRLTEEITRPVRSAVGSIGNAF